MYTDAAVKDMARTTYTAEHLKYIGQQCGNCLPPSSAVQAMFLYEMQRQTEAELLFQSQMFRMVRHEDTATAQTDRLDRLEVRMAEIEAKSARQDLEEHLATSKGRITAQSEKLNACSVRLEAAESNLTQISNAVEILKITTHESAAAFASIKTADNHNTIIVMKSEIDVLFEERNALLKNITVLTDRLKKLEDNVRALTLQLSRADSASTTGTCSPQLLPLQTRNGERVELAVPKGSSHVSQKENRPMTTMTTQSLAPGPMSARYLQQMRLLADET